MTTATTPARTTKRQECLAFSIVLPIYLAARLIRTTRAGKINKTATPRTCLVRLFMFSVFCIIKNVIRYSKSDCYFLIGIIEFNVIIIIKRRVNNTERDLAFWSSLLQFVGVSVIYMCNGFCTSFDLLLCTSFYLWLLRRLRLSTLRDGVYLLIFYLCVFVLGYFARLSDQDQL